MSALGQFMNIVILNIASASKLSIGLISLLLGACSQSVITPFQPHQTEESVTVHQTPATVKAKQSSELNTKEESFPKIALANLVDGNYRLCTEPPTTKTSSREDKYGWCFLFMKNSERVTGIYTYWEQSNYARICISGIARGYTISGSGYEAIEASSKPIKANDTARFPRGGIWDDWNKQGSNLIVGIPRLYSTGKYSDGRYYGWIIYDNIKLNLTEFHQHSLGKLTPPKKCPSSKY